MVTVPTHWLLFSHYHEHRKTPVCQLLHYWLMWVIVQSLQGSEVQSTSEAERKRQYYDHKVNAISIEPGNLVLAKADAYKGRRKVKDQWEEEPYEVECRIAETSLPTSWRTSRPDTYESFTAIDFYHQPCNGISFMFRCMSWPDKVCHHHPAGTYLES